MKYNTLIVDVYNLFYKATWVEEESIVKYKNEIFHTEGIIGFINLMKGYISKYGTEDVKIYWLFDNAKTAVTKYRKSISEDYKKSRIPQPEWFYKQLDMLELILKLYRNDSYLFRVKFLEADDYVSNIVKLYLSDKDTVLLISEDSDWSRALSDTVHQYMKHKVYTKKEFIEEYGFEPSYTNICFYKSIYGDSTDNIAPGLKELPKQFFLDIIQNFDTMHEFILATKNKRISYFDLGWIARVAKEESLLLTNWNLVESVNINISELDFYKVQCKYQPNKLQLIYSSLNLLGKIDDRFSMTQNDDNLLDELLKGRSINRKKS